MALILNIDTAIDTAGISLAEDGKLLGSATNDTQKDHASWIHVAIDQLFKRSGISLENIDAIGISIGPGSYTGLRIGLATAKGLCYALKIPMLAISSLKLIAFSAIQDKETPAFTEPFDNLLFCPMIDARRMEVYAAVYDHDLHEIEHPEALILNETSFDRLLQRQKILFLGNGSLKFQQVCHHPNAIFENCALNLIALATLTYRDFIGNNFAGLAYTDPLYLKEFFSPKATNR